jgi:glycosyltransferase involved in cell wall biosynthesis
MSEGRTSGPNPAFTVIVPFLNEERWLPQCIGALEQQTLDPFRFELIFVDNGSTDRSAEIVRQHSNIVLLAESRRDPYVARNRGIAAARGRYLIFLDADCIPEACWLEAYWNAVQSSDAPVVLGYLAHPADASVFLRCYEHYYDQKLKYLLRHKLVENYFGHAGNMAVRADIFRDFGPFQAMPIVGDTEIIHRLVSQRPDSLILYVNHARVVHAEVKSLRICMKKLYECGGYSETLAQISRYRPIPAAQKWNILMCCIRERNYGAAMTLATVVSLGLGWLSFTVGQAMRAWEGRPIAKSDPQLVPPNPARKITRI